MAGKNDGGPAFPTGVDSNYVEAQGKDYPEYINPGMTLRDWFAGQALAGLLASDSIDTVKAAGEWAYAYADAMLAAREVV